MKHSPKSKKTTQPTPPAEQLEALLKTKDYIPYHVDIPDREYPYVKLSIYGATKTNELFVQLTNGKASFVEVVSSPLLSPGMADRIFGMDVSDNDIAFEKAESMWQEHRGELIQK